LIVVLALELVYRLVALPPDYGAARQAAVVEPELVVMALPEVAEPAVVALEPVVDAIEPAAGGAMREPGLRLNRRLDPSPAREVLRLAAGSAPTDLPFEEGAAPPASSRPAAEAAAALVSLPLPPVHPPAAGRRQGNPLVAIVIDDMGYSPAALTRLARLPGPLTLAFLPYADATRPMLEAARRGDFELMLHMPMQPLGDDNPGPQALMVGLEPDELRRRVRWAIGQVPGVVGVNNHMGSRFTADAEGLAVVMEEFRRHGLFYLDSRTNGQSIAERTARAAGLPTSRRNVFIDHDPEARAIARQLALIERVAQLHGTAVAIGHPYPTTLAALEAWLPSLESRGFRLARVSEVIAERLCAEGRQSEQCGPALYLAGSDAAILPQGAGEVAP
jgi:uncharacterized protein